MKRPEHTSSAAGSAPPARWPVANAESIASSPAADSDRCRSAQLAAPSARAVQLALKRCLDLCVGALLLVLLSPVLGAAAIIVRLDSPGPVLFRQTRIGRRGRRFEMLKLRTMVCDATDDLHRELVLPMLRSCADDAAERGAIPERRIHKLANDPRITRAGRWLRRTSLDELPQLFNVLRGEMSLVGPRPPMPYEYDAYAAWQLERLEMPQGMTGLWQVSGRSYLSYRRMHELDIEYVRRWSLWLDLRILAKTVRAVFVDAEPTV
jgi:lipopolysaccharide/colanic/teichoic acid biosynthesis glycosyltransferase